MQKFTMIFTEQELTVIMQGLSELPAKMSMALIGNVNMQFNAQVEQLKKMEANKPVMKELKKKVAPENDQAPKAEEAQPAPKEETNA